MSLIGQLIFDGLAMGLVFIILAGGNVLIMSVCRILFMAYGVFYTIGAYITWYAVANFNLPYFPSLIIGASSSGILAMLSYILYFKPLKRGRGAIFLSTLIGAMGLSMVLNQGVLLVFGTVPQSIPAVFPGTFDKFGLNITIDKLVLIGLGIGVTLFLFWIYEKTPFGREMRAVAFLPEVASLQGINTDLIYMVTLGTSTALAAFAGGILAPSYGINPQMGANILWPVMLMTMLGGIDSLLGAVVGGLIIGELLSFGQYFIGGTVQIFVYLFIGVVLYFKPAGLLGHGIEIEI